MTNYTVVYRTGGTALCKWRCCLAVATKAEADNMASEINRMGYKALVFETDTLDTVGMPEGWNYNCTDEA